MKNIFKKKEKKLSEDPIDYLNKKKDHRFMFFTKWNRKPMNPKVKRGLKIASLVIFPLCAIALGTTIGVLASKKNDNSSLVNQVIIEDNQIKRRVYLISEDNYTVPLTVTIDKKKSVHEEMLDLINLLKVSSKAANEYVHGFIPDDTRVNSLTIKEKNMTIDFSEEFLNYNEKDEMRMVEALTSTMTQFDEVETISISVDSNKVSTLPKRKTPVIGKNVYLNSIMTPPNLLENKELVTVFYNRKYDSKNNYLVPISLYSPKGESANITFANALFIDLPSNRQLSNLNVYESISKTQTKNDEFSLTVNSSALIDETTVNKDLYDIVLLSLDLMNKETKVSFNIEGETLRVDGVIDEDSEMVSDIYYNEVEI